MVTVPHSHLQDSHKENWPVESEDVSPFYLDTKELSESEMAKHTCAENRKFLHHGE